MPAKSGRKPAPTVIMGHRDHRKEILTELDEQNPEFVHMYENADILNGRRDWEMRTKQQEVVKDDDGEVVHHMGDPVVRMPKELYDAQRKYESDQSETILKERVTVAEPTVYRSPRQPKQKKE